MQLEDKMNLNIVILKADIHVHSQTTIIATVLPYIYINYLT